MNSYYLFLTIHNSFNVDTSEIQKVLKDNFPSADITVNEFENVR